MASHQEPEKPSFLEKVKDLATGHKPGHEARKEAVEEKYETGRPITEAEKDAQHPPAEAKHSTIRDKLKKVIPGMHGHSSPVASPTAPIDVGQQKAVPVVLEGGAYHDTQAPASQGGVGVDASGTPVDMPTIGSSPKKEGLMAKVKDKLHIGGHKDEHHGSH